MRLATWNMKQAVAPRKPVPELWQWLEQTVNADVAVLTEARIPKDGLPSPWQAIWEPGGIGERRTWGTIIAGRGVSLSPVTNVKTGWSTKPLKHRWPAAVQVADVLIGSERWATIVGVYGLTVDEDEKSVGHGRRSVRRILRDLEPLLSSPLADRLLFAGDLNLWPVDAAAAMRSTGLVDLVEHTAPARPRLHGCSGCTLGAKCGHMWTHRNGNSPNAAVQNIDYLYASKQLVREVRQVTGGIRDYPDAWSVSDHAPVFADFG
jgi:exonuclease III